MYQILAKNYEKIKYITAFVITLTVLLLLAVVFKNDANIKKSNIDNYIQHPDLALLKEFLLKKIKSPFFNEEYEIKCFF